MKKTKGNPLEELSVHLNSYLITPLKVGDDRLPILKGIIERLSAKDRIMAITEVREFEKGMRIRAVLTAEIYRVTVPFQYAESYLDLADVPHIIDYVMNEAGMKLSSQLKKGLRRIFYKSFSGRVSDLDGCRVSLPDCYNILRPKKAFITETLDSMHISTANFSMRKGLSKGKKQREYALKRLHMQNIQAYSLIQNWDAMRKHCSDSTKNTRRLGIMLYDRAEEFSPLELLRIQGYQSLAWLRTKSKDALAKAYVSNGVTVGSTLILLNQTKTLGSHFPQDSREESNKKNAHDLSVFLYKTCNEADLAFFSSFPTAIESMPNKRKSHEAHVDFLNRRLRMSGAADAGMSLKGINKAYSAIYVISDSTTRSQVKPAYEAYKAKYGPSMIFHIDVTGKGLVEKDGDIVYIKGYSRRMAKILRKMDRRAIITDDFSFRWYVPSDF